MFGQSRPAQPPALGFPIHCSGHLHDDLSLRLLDAAADVFVIPSRQDNLPNTRLEAHACGTPVVVQPFDPLSLAAARHRAEQLWDPARVAGLYAEVYGKALERPRYAEATAGLGR